MMDTGDRLSQAAGLERKARQLEDQGFVREALRDYTATLEILNFVHRWEKNPQVKQIIKARVEEILAHAEDLKREVNGNGDRAPRLRSSGLGSGSVQTSAPTEATQPSPEVEVDGEKERLRSGLAGAILTEKPNVRWQDVAGLAVAKDALQETVILPAKFPQLFTGNREPWHGVLLYGPPGTGKTFLAKACATEADATFFSISSSDLVSKWMGESERLVRNLFEMAREHRPAVIFIDEVDSMCGARGASGESDAARRIKTELLAQMDGVGKSCSQVLVLGATNLPWDLDSAIRRRFEKRVYIPLPEAEARAQLLQLALGSTPHSCGPADFERIAQGTQGFSGADLSVLVRDAMYEPVRRCRGARAFRRVNVAERVSPEGGEIQRLLWSPCSAGDEGAVEMTLMQVKPEELLVPDVLPSDFDAALKKVRPSVSPSELKHFQTFTKMYGMEGTAVSQESETASWRDQQPCVCS